MQNHKLAAPFRFTNHPKVRWKLIVFVIAMYLSGSVLFYGIIHFPSDDASVANTYAYFTLIGTIAFWLSVVTASILLRCPSCKNRVYTISLMWRNRMPLGVNHNCPHCGFPDRHYQTNTEADSTGAQQPKPNENAPA